MINYHKKSSSTTTTTKNKKKFNYKGLDYLHGMDRIHRDVKGSNILIGNSGNIKLGDFGASSLSSTADTFTGSPCWMAPEVITTLEKNGEGSYDCKVDIWGVGILAIELANKLPPYYGLDASAAVHNIVTNPPPTLDYKSSPIHNISNQDQTNSKSDWSPIFHQFVNSCLNKDDPDARPSASELLTHPFITQNTSSNSIREFLKATRNSTLISSTSKGSLKPPPNEQKKNEPERKPSLIKEVAEEEGKSLDKLIDDIQLVDSVFFNFIIIIIIFLFFNF